MTNTKDTLIAERYSAALVDIAKEGKLTYTKISESLNLILETLNQSKDLAEFLTSPTVSIDDKKEVLQKVFGKEVDVLIINFLKLLVDKDRFFVFEEIVNSYDKALDDINNISRVQVISAVKMSNESEKKLKEKLESKIKKSVVLDLEISPEIIAGLVIKMGDNVIDMSLKHKLEDLSKNIG